MTICCRDGSCRFTTYRHRFARAAPAPRAKRNDAKRNDAKIQRIVDVHRPSRRFRLQILHLIILAKPVNLCASGAQNQEGCLATCQGLVKPVCGMTRRASTCAAFARHEIRIGLPTEAALRTDASLINLASRST